ncbi:UDP-N-acetylglucosamine 2-epimerase (non-hydrolysing) [Methanococcoides vulcani]|uniref:UDP-N-acetylglucosamine 2-epimerase (Non-hydrolysing) n=1 Tax=Methanococcoides vulcani TaxID=1353158 RepID=A0A1H9Z8L0_9EURY|nr:UDP-N-acetylglucosamine 2-epimerase (non-hydrolyzing) [Methanococcoides vulcani]SES77407.1 UDP-N-acetylglucosamine 2-epimerase (non-hydrolysing) [Methanococcoides vulcani]
MKVAIVLGTRPEIIKMSPIIRECEKQGLDYYILHTGQHYSHEMDRVFFEDLELPQPTYNLDVGSGMHGEQTGKMLAGIEQILLKDTPDVVLVQGDTNTVLAGALAASKLHIKVGHVEAGLRSFNRDMPEEINRIMADHISDYLFAPTENSRQYLLNEGIPDEKIHITGNTVVDAVFQNLEIAKRKTNVLEKFGVEQKGYFLTTIHRAENVDNKERLQSILNAFEQIHSKYELPMIFPAHPRTVKMMENFDLTAPEGTQIVEPVGYLDFLQLENGAKLIITDSGGLQEEACIHGVPCVTLRDNTERPETVEVGSNVVAGIGANIMDAVETMIKKNSDWTNPYGNGTAGELTIKKLL